MARTTTPRTTTPRHSSRKRTGKPRIRRGHESQHESPHGRPRYRPAVLRRLASGGSPWRQLALSLQTRPVARRRPRGGYPGAVSRIISPEAALDLASGPQTREAVGEAWADAHRALRAALLEPEIKTVWVTIGQPGAGKSTWLRNQPDDPEVVAFDAVHSQPGRRRGLAQRILTAGKQPIAIVVAAPLDLCLARNGERDPLRRVPEATLRRCWGDLQAWPVRGDEGWSEIWRVAGTDVRFDRRTTQAQDQEAGRVIYRWRTMEDSRVRSEHAKRHGRLFAWSRPPEGGHPGEDYGCRCRAEMVADEDVTETRGGQLRSRPLTRPTWARRRRIVK